MRIFSVLYYITEKNEFVSNLKCLFASCVKMSLFFWHAPSADVTADH